MAKKYLTIEEAAEIIGVEPSELSRMREKGAIRAFADRGTWKFRQDDVEELSRNREVDSDPDVPVVRNTPQKDLAKNDLASTVIGGSDSSSINLGGEVEEHIGEQPTIVRKGSIDLSNSDSDVRLVFDDSLMPDDTIDIGAPLSDLDHSDSDVRLIPSGRGDSGSDSDVKLVPDSTTGNRSTGSSVRGSNGPKAGSDSDVALVPAPAGDDFTLDLDNSDGSFVLGGETSGIALSGMGGGGNDSGITLESPNDSGITLEPDSSGISLESDSGITLSPDGSGIALEADDSGLILAGDSGISLAGPSDSGIALESLGGGRKGGKKSGKPDLGGTMPEIPLMGGHQDDADMGATQMEVPLLSSDQDSEFEFTASPLDEDSVSDVVLDGDAGSKKKKGRGKKAAADSDDLFDTAATTEFASDDDDDMSASSSDMLETSDAILDDDMAVSDDLIGEDDEIAEDVFGADDDDFDEELQSGQSAADFAVPAMSGASRALAPIQAEWGGGTFFMLLVSSAIMLLTSFLMYDVVRTMWGNNEPNAGTEMILATFRGMMG